MHNVGEKYLYSFLYKHINIYTKQGWSHWALLWAPLNIPEGNWLSLDLKIAFQVTFFIKEVEEKLIRAKITRDLRAERKLIMQMIISSQTFWMHLCALLQPCVHREEAVNDYLWPRMTSAWMCFIVRFLFFAIKKLWCEDETGCLRLRCPEDVQTDKQTGGQAGRTGVWLLSQQCHEKMKES